ncbi:MAG: hypothetical protein H5T86_14250 [Armatimonadetes bacterium]|nr:hypothetical protein [Armatimonadota bacterium]
MRESFERQARALSRFHPLRLLFTALVHRAFVQEMGIGDERLVGYLADLLARFVHVDNIFRIRDARGRPLWQVADMLAASEQVPVDRIFARKREVHRHIGDFTLFWTGVYPEALRWLQGADTKDHLLDYIEQGRRSYMLASQYTPAQLHDEAVTLARLAHEFEFCVWGLHRVRQFWEKRDPESFRASTDVLLS